MSLFVAALDLGQMRDYSALIILEARGTMERISFGVMDQSIGMEIPRDNVVEIMPITMMDIRHIERFELGTKYTVIGDQVERRLRGVPKPNVFVIDETGVGIGVAELFRHLQPHGITITGGNEASIASPGHYRVPKRDLVSPLQVRLQEGQLRIAAGLPHAGLLKHELENFRAKISTAGHDSYEAWREADHDDLVLAAAIGAWMAEEMFRRITLAVQDAIRAERTQRDYVISQI